MIASGVEHSARTTRPAAAVWDFMADFETSARWDAATVRVRRVHGDGAVGTVYLAISRLFGRDQSVMHTVTKLVAHRRIVLVGTAGRVRLRTTLDVEDLGHEVRVGCAVAPSVPGPAVLLRPMLLRRLQDNADLSEVELRRALDAL